MNIFKTIKHSTIIATTLFLAVNATYNYYIVNSVKMIDGKELVFIKRLDDLNKDYRRGRFRLNFAAFFKTDKQTIKPASPKVASNSLIKKQKGRKSFAKNNIDSKRSFKKAASKEPGAGAAIKDDLYLEIAEFQNPKLYARKLGPAEVSGNLMTNAGIIDSMDVSLPNGDLIRVSGSEMKGNVFSYELDGAVYSGMMYEVRGQGYMITLTNGPYQGSRMKFMKDISQLQDLPQQETYQNIAAGSARPQKVRMGSNPQLNRNPTDNFIEYDQQPYENYNQDGDRRIIANEREEYYEDGDDRGYEEREYQNEYYQEDDRTPSNYEQTFQEGQTYSFGQN